MGCLYTYLKWFLIELNFNLTNKVGDGSGWIFEQIICFDIRICHSLPQNYLHFGLGGKKITFHPLLKNIFERRVYDPNVFLSARLKAQNLCVPVCIILGIMGKLGPTIRHMTKMEMEAKVNLLPYKNLIDPTAESIGLSLQQLSSFEDLLSPIPIEMVQCWPNLAIYSGIAINVFSIQRQKNEFRIFPNSLSRFSRNSNYYQTDLLIENTHIKPEGTKDERAQTFGPHALHTLAIKNIGILMAKFQNKGSSYERYSHVCRTCTKVFVSHQGLHDHYKTCNEKRRGAMGKRRTLNRLIHRPIIKNKFTGKWERNGLRYKRKDISKLLRPLLFSVADFESYHVKVNKDRLHETSFENPLSSSLTYQKPMAYAWTHKSMYEEYDLPTSLGSPRVLFLNEAEENPEKSFFLSIFLQMRRDLLLYSNWLQELWSLDQPPPAVRYRTPEQIAYFRSIKSCQLCGILFGKKLWSEKSKRFYVVRRSWDHCHILHNSANVRAIICQVRSFSIFLSFLKF